MKKLILITTMLILLAPVVQAKSVLLTDIEADNFIREHFPDAYIPGDVKGVFSYSNKKGEKKHGYAECHYPAMGERGEGGVTTCHVTY